MTYGEELSPLPGKSLIAPTGSLTVTDVENSDEGEYMCKATNIEGTATMHTRLDVRSGLFMFIYMYECF